MVVTQRAPFVVAIVPPCVVQVTSAPYRRSELAASPEMHEHALGAIPPALLSGFSGCVT